MIPINRHLIIEPLKHEGFIATQRETYQEIGIIIGMPLGSIQDNYLKKGDKVLFDSWLAKKFPKEGTDGYYWLVKYDDIVAYEPIPEEHL